jgi:hypothetical protein
MPIGLLGPTTPSSQPHDGTSRILGGLPGRRPDHWSGRGRHSRPAWNGCPTKSSARAAVCQGRRQEGDVPREDNYHRFFSLRQ